MRIFRLHRGHRRADDYAGSLIVASRWNPAGIPILYCSTALSLACLEILVHLAPEEIPIDYVYSFADLDGEPEISDFRGSLLNEGATRRHGQYWATSRLSLALRVPSVIVPIEFNVLLNPVHEHFGSLEWSAPEPFGFDPRLLKRSNASPS